MSKRSRRWLPTRKNNIKWPKPPKPFTSPTEDNGEAVSKWYKPHHLFSDDRSGKEKPEDEPRPSDASINMSETDSPSEDIDSLLADTPEPEPISPLIDSEEPQSEIHSVFDIPDPEPIDDLLEKEEQPQDSRSIHDMPEPPQWADPLIETDDDDLDLYEELKLEKQRSNRAKGWNYLLLSLFTLTGLFLFMFRDTISTGLNASPSSSYISAVTPFRLSNDIEIEDVRTAWAGNALIVTGNIRNIADGKKPLPELVFVIYDHNQKELQRQAIILPVGTLPAGGNVHFENKILADKGRAGRFEVSIPAKE